jgi:hypothetical protein
MRGIERERLAQLAERPGARGAVAGERRRQVEARGVGGPLGRGAPALEIAIAVEVALDGLAQRGHRRIAIGRRAGGGADAHLLELGRHRVDAERKDARASTPAKVAAITADAGPRGISGRWVSSSNSVTPSANTSARSSRGSPRACSGAM